MVTRSSPTDTTPTAGRREWIGLAVLVLPCVLVSMDLSVLFLALPFLSADLRPSGTELLWIMDIYGFLLAGLLITMGSLGDRIGRRRLLLCGGSAFAAASVLAAYSDSPMMLIAARALLGVAGATLAPATLSLIRNMFHDAKQRMVAVSVWTAGFSGGALIGPIAGGILLEHFWWGSVFLINVPVMVLLLILGPLLLPEFRDPRPGKLDLVSVVLSLGAVLLVIYGIKKLAADGAHWLPVATIVVGSVLGVVFVRRQGKLSTPMFDVRLFAERPFSVALLAGTLMMFVMTGFGWSSSQYLQLVLDMRPFTAALWTLPMFGGMAVGIGSVAALTRWLRPGHVVGVGFTVAAAGFAGLTQVDPVSGLPVLVVAGAVMAAGLGMVAALATDMVVATAPPERAGAASALSETGSEFGGALGIALLGGAAATVYRARMADALPPGVPPEAGETLGATAESASGLPARVGDPLLTAAQAAFTDGLQVTALIAACLTAVAAVAATVLLGRVQKRDSATELH